VARAHGGKAWVESPGHDEVNFPGCTFHLQLPVNAPGTRAKAESRPSGAANNPVP